VWGDGEMGRWGDGEIERFLLSNAAPPKGETPMSDCIKTG